MICLVELGTAAALAHKREDAGSHAGTFVLYIRDLHPPIPPIPSFFTTQKQGRKQAEKDPKSRERSTIEQTNNQQDNDSEPH
jgi:hypothetical protein